MESGSVHLTATIDRLLATPCDESRHHEMAARDAEREENRKALELARLIRRRGARYEACTIKNYRAEGEKQERVREALIAYARDLQQQVRDGVGVVLFGPSGTGKDHLLMALAKYAIGHFGISVEWRNGVDIYSGLRDGIDEARAEREILAPLIRSPVLWISDPIPPTAKGLTDYQRSALFQIVDARYSHKRPTWLSANVLSGDEASERMGGQVVDRLRHAGLHFVCDWPSYRSARP